VGRLAFDDGAQAERLGAEDNADQREAESKLIADHLRGSAKAAQQGEFVVRRPAGERDAVDPDRGNAKDNEQADVDVGDSEDVHAMNAVDGAERDDGDGDKSAGERDDRSDHKQRPLGCERHQILFQKELDTVGERLQKAERTDAGGSPAVLNVTEYLALQQHRIGDRRQQDDEDDGDLDDAEQQKYLERTEMAHDFSF